MTLTALTPLFQITAHTTAARFGFKAVVGGHVIPVHNLDGAAAHVADAFRQGKRCNVFARTTLTRERQLTASEQADLVARATLILAG